MKKLLIILSLAMTSMPLRAQDFTPVNVFIPAFHSPNGKANIGYNTASILSLQIWRTYSTPTDSNSFDNANISYNSEVRPTSYLEVESLARKQTTHPNLVLWGKAWQFGDGIVVESNLLVRKGVDRRNLGSNIWSVSIPTRRKTYTISVDIPEWQYEFAPIVLDPHLVLQLTKTNPIQVTDGRSSVAIHEMKSLASPVLRGLGVFSMRAVKHVGDWSQVSIEADDEVRQLGWIYLPNLSQNSSEVVNFCGGVIRLLRKDWPGTLSLFQEVLVNSEAPTAIRVNSSLFMAIAYAKLLDDDRSFSMVAAAYRLNPYSKTTTKYLCMSYFSKLARAISRGANRMEIKTIVESTREILSKNRVLFGNDDRWILQAEQVLEGFAD